MNVMNIQQWKTLQKTCKYCWKTQQGLNHVFYIDLGPNIFIQNQESIAKMLEGYGLQWITSKPARSSKVTLVETMSLESTCPIRESQCRNHSCIHIQSEQYFRDHIMDCHKSPNCVILEFSDYNYCIAWDQDLGDSFVLLPVMTQIPSQISSLEPMLPKNLTEQSYDIVFFGLFTRRQKILHKLPRNFVKTLRSSICSAIVFCFPFISLFDFITLKVSFQFVE